MMPGPVPGVMCCGSVSHDTLVRPVAAVEWGTTRWVERPLEAVGGHGANTSTALARLGVPVRLIGLTGSDRAGDFLRDRLRESGVGLERLGRAQGATTQSVVLIDPTGERASLNFPGAAGEVTAEFVMSAFDGAPYSHFHLATFFGLPKLRLEAAAVLREARRRGLSCSLDPNWDALGRWMTDLEPCLPFVDLLLVNESEAARLTGEAEPAAAASVLRENGAGTVVVKLGAKGCAVFAAGEAFCEPGFAVEAIDTTGAGDCFAGGWLASRHRGATLSEAARFANAVGALSVQQTGANAGVLSYEETSHWIEVQS
jgi:ribokinase